MFSQIQKHIENCARCSLMKIQWRPSSEKRQKLISARIWLSFWNLFLTVAWSFLFSQSSKTSFKKLRMVCTNFFLIWSRLNRCLLRVAYFSFNKKFSRNFNVHVSEKAKVGNFFISSLPLKTNFEILRNFAINLCDSNQTLA